MEKEKLAAVKAQDFEYAAIYRESEKKRLIESMNMDTRFYLPFRKVGL